MISKVGVTPATAAPLELRDNPDGTTSPWHDGYPVVDFESGDPLVIPAGTSDADALKIVKGARPFGRNSKYFAVASEASAAEPALALASSPIEADAPALSPLTQARNTLIDMRTQLEAQGQVVDDRLLGRIKQQEKLVKEMEADEAQAAPPAPAKFATKAEAKPEVKPEPAAAPPAVTAPVSDVKAETPATLTDEKAFADDYAAFEGQTVEQPVQVEETGQTLKMRMDAATALRELDKRRKALEALKACLEKA